MASFFIPGEQKIRPGVYFRYENYGAPPLAGADDGRCAAVLRSNWGPLGQAVTIENFNDIAAIYGDGGAEGTTAVILEQFRGGARSVTAVRIGSGGTQGSYQIMSGSPAIPVIQLTMRHPGNRAFALTIRPTLDDPNNRKELLLTEGTASLERFTFASGTGVDQVAALMSAAAASAYFTLTKLADAAAGLTTINQAAITPGTNPTAYDVAAYSAAFEILEAQRWNVLAIDTNDVGVQAVMQMYLNRVYRGGKFVIGVLGEDSAVGIETRMQHASAFNDYQIVYVGTGFIDSAGTRYEGWQAAARVAGLIAGTPSNESITHTVITGAVDMTEPLTNNMYERAILAGMLTFSTSSTNAVWVESGINTLNAPTANDDAGWKKIKRVKVRFELMQRMNDTVEGLIGNIDNNENGRMTIVQSGNAVCNAMVTERKLLTGAQCEIDPDNTPTGDSAWFRVTADDIDALEKMYFTFRFRFAPEEA